MRPQIKLAVKIFAGPGFESPYVDMPHRLTVRQNLRVFARLYAVTDIEGKIARLAEDLALVEFLDRPSGSLSAGQKTRVALAKALITILNCCCSTSPQPRSILIRRIGCAPTSRRIAATATARSCSPRIIWRRSNAYAIG
jgi:hypothetical protein